MCASFSPPGRAKAEGNLGWGLWGQWELSLGWSSSPLLLELTTFSLENP